MATEMMIDKVAAVLHEAAETHHQVYRITDGVDTDWASWYGDWLARLSELPTVLGTNIVRSEVVYLLVMLDREYSAEAPDEAWEPYYARRFLQHWAAQSG